MISPLAFTISISKILSTPNPYEDANGPCPPPIDQPIIPTVKAHPDDTNRLF